MRLINTTTYERCDIYEIEQSGTYDTPVRYAILSHRWRTPELLYANYTVELLRSTETSPTLTKIRQACKQAAAEMPPLHWIWIDNVCIDKSSSTELSEAINSMFAWYRDAKVCYAYLDDTSNSISQSSGEPSEWFSRGWTLQELIAPREMTFFDTSWKRLGTRAELARNIETATRIEAKYLDGRESFRSASIAARLSWQASRTTTRVEDMTYSLLGVLEVSLDIRYGEGPEAFLRLQTELLHEMSSTDESLFAWIMRAERLPLHSRSKDWKEDEWGLLAPSPQCFYHSTNIVAGSRHRRRPPNGFTRTGDGVVFPMPYRELHHEEDVVRPLMALQPLSYVAAKFYHKRKTEFNVVLNCELRDPSGIFRPVKLVFVRDGKDDRFWRRQCSDFSVSLKTNDSDLEDGRDPISVTVLQPKHLVWQRDGMV